MRETNFIEQNKEKWKEFEQNLDHKYTDPDNLNDLFVQITDDLSYSRTFYPNRSVRVYLNGLAQRIFFSIYKNKKSRRSRLFGFWTDELPQLVYEARRAFQIAFWLFLVSALIGALSCAMEPDFVRTILGDTYVNMTLENIRSGDPMAVYKEGSEFGGFLGITANNLFVAFQAFVSGVFFAIGTLGILVFNGVMVGAFQFFFFEQGIYAESVLTIWMHGTFEISAIIISGAAGLTMGKGLVFPGTLSRLKAFQLSARRGVKIMIGVVPLFVMAGFIEGYLTRHTEAPDILRAAFILLCLFYVIGYFVVYPRIRAKKGFDDRLHDSKLIPDSRQGIDFSAIKNRGSIFSDSFFFFRKHFWKLSWTAVGMAALYCLAVFSLSGHKPQGIFGFDWSLFGTFIHLDQFFSNVRFPFLPLLNILIFSVITYVNFDLLIKEEEQTGMPKKEIKPRRSLFDFLKILAGCGLLIAIIQTDATYTPFLMFLVFPPLFLWLFEMKKERLPVFEAMRRTLYLSGNNYGRIFGVFFVFLITGILFFLLLDTPFIWSVFQFIAMNFNLDQSGMDALATVMMTFSTMLLLYLEMILFLTGAGLLYYTLVEIKEAPFLKENIKYIGNQKRIRGLEREG